MRHYGVLESQALYAMGVRPEWSDDGRVTGTEIIPAAELKRPHRCRVIGDRFVSRCVSEIADNYLGKMGNFCGMLGSDDPFEYFGALSLAAVISMDKVRK